MAPKDTSKISYSRADSGYLSDLISLARESDEAAAALLTSSPSRSSSSIEFTLRTFDDTDWNDVGRSSRQVTRQNRQCRAIAARIKTPTRFPIKPLAGTMARARKEVERMAARKSGGSFARSVYAQPVASQPMVCKMQDGSSQRGLWVDGKWFLPHQPLQMGSGFAKVPTGPKRITIINRGTVGERDFKPKRIVLINRRPDQANENTIKSGGTECAISGEKEKSQSVDGFGRTRAATKKIREQGLEFDTTNKIRRKRKSEDSVQGVRQGKMSKLDTSE
ncbi:hypothetical protein HBI21_054330 [Parastagonospora nodorum]|nr:hypothetical protein HBH72_107890 [Parastagonospora nodorum]KAH5681851.1 hypothetical protein HBI21_054330 [Parastagonospora nodorum]